jgi:hypothetical protein
MKRASPPPERRVRAACHISTVMSATKQNQIKRLSPERIAELTRQPALKTDKERRDAIRRATTGLRFGARVTRSMYRPR